MEVFTQILPMTAQEYHLSLAPQYPTFPSKSAELKVTHCKSENPKLLYWGLSWGSSG